MPRHLIVFVKVPHVGFVKTRLAAEIGRIAAWRFYRQSTGRLLNRLIALPRTKTTLFVAPGQGAFGASAWPAGFQRRPQSGGDIGRRMQRAMLNCSKPTLLIGSDIPAIRNRHLEAAFRLLKTNDLVFGPAADGGFWLIGSRRGRLPPGIFKQVRWSSRHTLADVRANIPNHLRVGFAATLRDVDNIEDWRAYQAASQIR